LTPPYPTVRRGTAAKPLRRRRRCGATGLLFLGLLAGLMLSELGMAALGLPRVYKTHSREAQFAIPVTTEEPLLYTSRPSANIRFVYDGDPRGYFGPHGESSTAPIAWGSAARVHSRQGPRHVADSVLGDSFTFGEEWV